MKKISKLFTILALCGLFVFSNTSGIEEKTPIKKAAPLANDFVSGQWYQLNLVSYINPDWSGIDNFIPTTYAGDLGVNYSYMGGDYFSCHKIYFASTHWTLYYDNTAQSLYYDTVVDFGEYLSICFSQYRPNSLISYYKYFTLVDNESYDNVYLTYNLDLLATNFQPLIYLGYAIFDNFFVQYRSYDHPSPTDTVNFFEGQFVSGGSTFVGMKATYYRYNGYDYTIDGSTPKQVPLDAGGHGLYVCTSVHYIRPDLTEMAAMVMSNYYIGDSAYPSNLVFKEKKYASILIKTYSTEIDIIPSNRAYNSFEALTMRPEKVDYGFTDNGNVFTNAFSLIGLVYTSLAGFLSFQIFPGLTLGLFILIPLVITIIVLIFKAVK